MNDTDLLDELEQLAVRRIHRSHGLMKLLVKQLAVVTHHGTLRVPYRRAARAAFPRGAWER